MNITIVGAGLTGMIAAHIFQQARVLEASTYDKMTPHKALLRFRSNAVEEVTGIPFRQVTVRKGIWNGRDFIQPDIRAANAYSIKCTGQILPRSLWDISPCQRWIAPNNFIEILQDNLKGRIEYGRAYSFENRSTFNKHMSAVVDQDPVISTVPMKFVAEALEVPLAPKFSYKPICVYRGLLGEEIDVHQTIYFPFFDTGVYRASITGNVMIAESTNDELTEDDFWSVSQAFNINLSLRQMERTNQKFGKIAPVDEGFRRSFIYKLSDELGIYSLGRFGTWRNILLDDVVHDCAVIKRLILSDGYGKGRIRAGN